MTQGTVRFEASLLAVKHPRCDICHSANPTGAKYCPKCGSTIASATETRREASIAVNIDDGLVPWHARALLAMGAWLRRLALWIKGE